MGEPQQKTVLVVEDEESLRRIMVRTLEQGGYSALAASSGDEGLAIALHKHPDLILLDIVMPHDGIKTIEELRRDETYGKQVPVIFLTNLTPDSQRVIDAIEKYEPAFYLIKADNAPSLVLEKVAEALAKPQ